MKKSHLLGTVCVCFISSVSVNTHALGVSGQGTWESTLLARDLDGNTSTIEGYYDTVLDITWLADTNAAGTGMTWIDANNWANGLSYVDSVKDVTYDAWRLPTFRPVNGTNYEWSTTNNASTDRGHADNEGWVDSAGNPTSEMGNMYYVTLGNIGVCTPDDNNPTSCVQQPGWGLTNRGPFDNLRTTPNYWSNVSVGTGIGSASEFNFNDGGQTLALYAAPYLAWAVHEGDIGTPAGPIITAIGGDTQECSQEGGTEVVLDASGPPLPPGETVIDYQWLLDGSSVGSGAQVSLFIELGRHVVVVVATTSTGEMRNGSTTIEVLDTTGPLINIRFTDSKTGAIITSVVRKADVEVSFDVSDACDPTPTYTSGLGLSVQSRDVANVRGNKKDSSITLTSAPNIDNVVLNIIATDAAGNVSAETAVLPVTP